VYAWQVDFTRDIQPGDRAWFVADSDTMLANIHYRTLVWSGNTPVLSNTSILTTPAFGQPLPAPANGSVTPIDCSDSRMQMAVIRSNHLWTCRMIGVNSGGGAASPTRTGCEWYDLNVTNPTATLFQSGRVFDPTVSNPRFYYYPSIMVSGQGHAVMGFSGSKTTEFIGAFSSSRLAGDPPGTMSAPATVKAGLAPYERLDGFGLNRWGEYSYTSLDPNDDMSLWTIQEFAAAGSAALGVAGNTWGTWIAKFQAPPPATPTSSNPRP
jgi:hypothetical protein